jgi:hypothetical protein
MGMQGERGTEMRNHGMREGFSRGPHFIIDSVLTEFAAAQKVLATIPTPLPGGVAIYGDLWWITCKHKNKQKTKTNKHCTKKAILVQNGTERGRQIMIRHLAGSARSGLL